MEKDKQIEQDWDIYWADKDQSSNVIYDFLAGIYRRLIVRNILNHFVKKYCKSERTLYPLASAQPHL